MAVLFQSRVGSVVRMNDPATQCSAFFKMADPVIGFETEKAIITRLVLNHQVNVQFLHTLGALIYIYVFGDRIGSLNLSGLAFCTCSPDVGGVGRDQVAQVPASGSHGASKMFEWYKKYRTSKRKDPARISIGDSVLEGFIVGFSEDVVDASLNLVQWNLSMMTLPEDEG